MTMEIQDWDGHKNVSGLNRLNGILTLPSWLIFGVLTPLSAIFQLYHGDQF
jgi:hypothetical protein